MTQKQVTCTVSSMLLVLANLDLEGCCRASQRDSRPLEIIHSMRRLLDRFSLVCIAVHVMLSGGHPNACRGA